MLASAIWRNIFDEDPVIATFLIAAMLVLLRSTLFWLYFIQMKNYRLDRILLEFKNRTIYRLIFSWHRIIVLVAIMVPIVGFIFERYAGGEETIQNYGMLWFLLIILYLLLYALHSIYLAFRRKLQRPRVTVKLALLFLFIALIESYVIFGFANILPYFVFEILQPFIVLAVFALAYTPNIFLHRHFITRAKNKIAAHKNLIVIGITGSYGKTTTKEYLAHILSKKYCVLKTPAHINVDTGVAKVILKDLSSPFEGEVRRGLRQTAPTPPNPPSGRGGKPEVFIVEMGAYKRGEIKKICDLVHPQYAVMTGLSNQHLELFGSLEAIVSAKFELVEAVSGQDERIIANAESTPLIAEFKNRSIRPIWYGSSALQARFIPTAVIKNQNGVSFSLNGIAFSAPAIGTAALNNLLGAITAAAALGQRLEEIAAAVSELPKVEGSMQVKTTPGGALLIDDTYNANTQGVLAALNDLPLFNRAQKIFVFGNVIELGKQTREDHVAIANAAARVADYIVLLKSPQYTLMHDAIRRQGVDASKILEPDNIKQLRELCSTHAVILLEGRDARKIMRQLL